MPDDQTKLDVASLDEFLKRVSSYDVNLIYTQGDVQRVHHYTDLGGLNGIVAGQDLWLTHSRFSNDDEEMTHGHGIVRSLIDERLARGPSPAEQAFLEGLRQALGGPDPESVYICCFCKDGDLLSQWRAYGANGTGVSLAFEPGGFAFITGPDSPRHGLLRLWSVFYRHETQRYIVEEAFRFGLETGSTPQDQVRRAADAIRFFIPTFKNERFAEEEEIRLIFTPAANATVPPDFRVARGMLVPYYRLQALCGDPRPPRALPLRSVRIGPSTRKALNAQAARLLLAKAGAAALPVDVSETPYRG